MESKHKMTLCSVGAIVLGLVICFVCKQWCDCDSCSTDIEFHHGDKVRVIGGFYTGKTGEVREAQFSWGNPYQYRVDFDPSSRWSDDQWIPIDDLELVSDFDPIDLE